MKNLLMTKSSDSKSDLVKEHASRRYKSTGKHLLLIYCRVTSSEAIPRIFENTAFGFYQLPFLISNTKSNIDYVTSIDNRNSLC